jgi:hypothetical protein
MAYPPFDDFDVDLAADLLQALLEFRALIAAIGVELEQKGIKTEQCAHE